MVHFPLPKRPLGKTGLSLTLLGLGGEGILRTHGRHKDAVAVIEEAIGFGINFFDTSPVYADCLTYCGAVIGDRRRQITLASKTHDRNARWQPPPVG